ncbi:hypothetical protein Psch_03527 [Pelotomaculum schinkii]|uniref:Uncharacterized protein n=1 Tax=Pelotomaculum schinkii TaxID=78350 RepID=A0A4Y7R760_9FIRM|nr:DUF3150 domain-containing protein [Pelotomaculum schinkii]TEB04765.1 hypothetical protein Psch_03527 [Pelotomaculum schinkii]
MDIRNIMDDLLKNIAQEEGDKSIVDQKNEIADRLGCDPDDIRVRMDATATKLARKGILVDLKITRERFELLLDAVDLGIEAKDDYGEFLDEYIKLGRRRLIPLSYLKNLDAVETRARRLLKESSFNTAWGHFVPYQVYDELRRRLEEFKVDYKRYHDSIIADYDSIRASTYMKYREAAQEVYRTLQKDPYASVPEYFVENFVFRVMNAFPSVEEIEGSYKFEINLSFVPVTTTMAEMETRMANAVMARAENAVAEEIRQSYTRHVEGFISDLAAQLRSMIFEAVSAAQESVKRHGHLPGPSVNSLRQLVGKVQALNFMEDRVVIQQLGELSGMLEKESKDRDAGETLDLLKKIAEENRQVLLSLGHKPRATRGRVTLETEQQVVTGGRKRRGVVISGSDENRDMPVEGGRRRRGGVPMQTMAV